MCRAASPTIIVGEVTTENEGTAGQGMTCHDGLNDGALHQGATDAMPDLLDDLKHLICLESPSSDQSAVAASARHIGGIVKNRLGVAPELIEVDGCSHLRLRFGAGPRQVVIITHHDTVWPLGTLARIPFSITEGILRGPACFDMKTGLAMAIHALSLLQQSLPADGLDGVSLLITGDEELGSHSSRSLIEEEARGCAAAYVLEASGDGGALKTERKGVSLYRLTIVGRAAHAGLEPEKGINAGIELAHQILAAAQLGDSELGTSVTPTTLDAGSTSNTVPADAHLSIDVRACTATEQHRVDDAIRGLAPVLTGSEIVFSGGINRPPMEGTSSARLFARAVNLAGEMSLGQLSSVAVGGGSDGNFTAGIGVPTLDGMGAVGGGAHAVSEHVIVDEIASRTALLAALICDQLRQRNT